MHRRIGNCNHLLFFAMMVLMSSLLDHSMAVDCDFRKDTCGWKSIIEYIKAQDSSQICGRGGHITNCLPVKRFNVQFTWSRMKIGDIPYDQIKSGFGNLQTFVYGFVDKNVIPGLKYIHTSSIVSESLPFSMNSRSLRYSYSLLGNSVITVSRLSGISVYKSEIIAAHKSSSSAQMNVTEGCVDLPFEADIKIVIRGIFENSGLKAVLLSEVLVTNGLCHDDLIHDSPLQNVCAFPKDDCMSSDISNFNSSLNISLCSFCEGKNFNVSYSGSSTCYCRGDNTSCQLCKCSDISSYVSVENIQCDYLRLNSITTLHDIYVGVFEILVSDMSIMGEKSMMLFGFNESQASSLIFSKRETYHFFRIFQGILTLVQSPLEWYIVGEMRNFSASFSATTDYFYFADNNLKDATDIGVGVWLSFMTTNFSNCKISSAARIRLDSKVVDLSRNKIKSYIIHDNNEVVYIQNNLLNKVVGNNALINQIPYLRLSVLDMSINRITSLQREDFRYYIFLVYLNLSQNLIKQIAEDTFTDLEMLVSLDLSGNKIAHLYREHFRSLIQLQYLYLQENEITRLSADVFHGLGNMRYLQVESFSICCVKPQSLNNIKCVAPLNEISSCDYLIAVPVLNVAIWYMALLALFGNLSVLVYNLFYFRNRAPVSYFILTVNLSCADLLMGVYLFIIAIVNLQYTGSYGVMDYTWRHSWLCTLAGIIATVSSEASAFIVLLITVDRFLAIRYFISEKRITKRRLIFLCVGVWVLSVLIAIVPVLPFPVSFFEGFYSQSGICISLPLSAIRKDGWQYSMVIFVGLNAILFLGILIGQIAIFVEAFKVGGEVRTSKIQEREISLAKTLIAIVITDMLCWIPVGIIGMVTFLGIDVSNEVYAWISVLVLPVNSALNPLLYTLTAVVRQRKQFHLNRLAQENMFLRKQLDTAKSSSLSSKHHDEKGHGNSSNKEPSLVGTIKRED